MKILLIGSGGREHALAWKMARSPRVQKVFVTPGNGGTANQKNEGIENLPISDLQELADFAKREQIAFTVVGPEAPLAAGIGCVSQSWSSYFWTYAISSPIGIIERLF